VRSGLTAVRGEPADETLFRSTLDAFDRCYRSNLYRSSRVYPGVRSTLDELRKAGCGCACITNKRESYARALLDRAGIAEYLQFVYGGDTFERRKPDAEPLLRAAAACGLDPGACVMIGDSGNDRLAARVAGFRFVFAAYGYGRRDDATLNDGLGTIASITELPALLCLRQAAK